MPIPVKGEYPEDWPQIAIQVKRTAGWCCVRCGNPHDPPAGYTLTVHHLDGDKANCRWWNLAALCQRCHLRIQGRLYLDRPWTMLPHSEWFKPYVSGFYAYKYLALEISRAEALADLEWWSTIEFRGAHIHNPT